MEKATSYLISVSLIAFGVWIATAETRSHLFAIWVAVAIIPTAIGLFSIFDEFNNTSS